VRAIDLAQFTPNLLSIGRMKFREYGFDRLNTGFLNRIDMRVFANFSSLTVC